VEFHFLDVGSYVNLCDRIIVKESVQMNRDIFSTTPSESQWLTALAQTNFLADSVSLALLPHVYIASFSILSAALASNVKWDK
jgi:hypothetical protein